MARGAFAPVGEEDGCCKLVGLASDQSVYRKQMGYACSTPYFFRQNLSFIIPPARDDIEPCLLVVALMSLIAPPVRTEPSPLSTTGRRKEIERGRASTSPKTSFLFCFSRFFSQIAIAQLYTEKNKILPFFLFTLNQSKTLDRDRKER